MRTRHIGRGATGAVAAAAALTLALSGCGRGDGGGNSPEGSPGATEGGGGTEQGITDTSILLGSTTSLSGVAGAPGSCLVAGMEAYFGAANADGGVEFGDGKTRKVELKAYDDAYDPGRAVANFRQMIAEGVFANVNGLGTRTNLAIMPVATEEEFPQVFVASGDSVFSEDPEANPWTIGWMPTYYAEGNSFGKFLVDSGTAVTVAVLEQNDDAGNEFVAGLEDAIEGSEVEIVQRATFEPGDPTVDAQMAQLADSEADVFFSANTVPALTASSMVRAQDLGWTPSIFLAAVAANERDVLEPGNASAFPNVYSTGFTKQPTQTDDEEVKQFLADIKEYAPDTADQIIPHCLWGYATAATLEEAFKNMAEPTHEALMEAVRNVKDFEPPLLLDGLSVDTTTNMAPISEVQVQEHTGEGYAPAESYAP